MPESPESIETEISVIVPVVERHDDLGWLFIEFSKAFDKLQTPYEFIFVIGGERFDKALARIGEIDSSFVRIIKLTKNASETEALSVAVERSRGKYIFTLASYFQVETDSIDTIWKELGKGYDMVITRRSPRIDSRFNQLQSYVYHWMLMKLTSLDFHDITCGLRGMKKEIFEDINLYGDLHRFIPILALNSGYKVKEIKAHQRKENLSLRFMGISDYMRRILDILSLVFITQFTMKPLRFFGLVGGSVFMLGSLITGCLGIYRILGLGGISNRPLLLLGVLLMVLGVQTLSIGFIGEIIIFTHAKNVKEYKIEKLLGFD